MPAIVSFFLFVVVSSIFTAAQIWRKECELKYKTHTNSTVFQIVIE